MASGGAARLSGRGPTGLFGEVTPPCRRFEPVDGARGREELRDENENDALWFMVPFLPPGGRETHSTSSPTSP